MQRHDVRTGELAVGEEPECRRVARLEDRDATTEDDVGDEQMEFVYQPLGKQQADQLSRVLSMLTTSLAIATTFLFERHSAITGPAV